MNFLSHFYLHNDKEDNYFTVGLTMPDLLGFHSKRIRITKNYLINIINNIQNKKIKSLALGMIMHLEIDKWFHNTDYFKDKLVYLQNKYNDKTYNKDMLPQFYAHIIMEILIDRYLLDIEPDIADRFYESYKKFNFNDAADLFHGLKNFDKEKFLKLSHDVSHSSFLKEYIYDDCIINILKRVTRRINIPFELDYDEFIFADFIKSAYNELKTSIGEFIKDAKNSFYLDKNFILNFN